ncbi:MAG TPA: hypothetical protein VFQ53_27890 [Kofleriaceae bacterium]|nr:hypothetical protein [Kofleriaceae bacterium]
MRWIVVAVALASACSKSEDPGPPCAQVVDHMLEVTQQTIVGHGDMGANGQRGAMLAQCEQRKMPAATRRCLVAAKTLDQIASCRAGKTDNPPTAPTTAGSAAPGPIKPKLTAPPTPSK